MTWKQHHTLENGGNLSQPFTSLEQIFLKNIPDKIAFLFQILYRFHHMILIAKHCDLIGWISSFWSQHNFFLLHFETFPKIMYYLKITGYLAQCNYVIDTQTKRMQQILKAKTFFFFNVLFFQNTHSFSQYTI